MRAAQLQLLAALVLVCADSAAAQPLQLRSEAGHFTLVISGLANPEPVNHLHGLDLQLQTSDGKPATGATIVIAGMRHDSSNPLPTMPRASPAPGDGNYRLEGLRFHMPGQWHLVLDIECAQIRDRAALDIAVK